MRSPHRRGTQDKEGVITDRGRFVERGMGGGGGGGGGDGGGGGRGGGGGGGGGGEAEEEAEEEANQLETESELSFSECEQVSPALKAVNSESINLHLSPPGSWEP